MPNQHTRIVGGCLSGAAIVIVPAAEAGELDFDLELAGEMRFFPEEPAFPGQLETFQPSFTVKPDIRWDSEDRSHQVVVTPFVRVDTRDEERTHFDLREAYYRFNGESNYSLTVGLAKVFWGRTESRHLVDIINQTDAVEDIDEEDKLGQPMVNLTLLNDWGTVDLFLMSGFRDRTFPGEDGRLRFSDVIDTDNAIFTRDGRRASPDFAVRYSHYVGDWDFGVAGFFGTSREPRFAFDTGGSFRPIYDRIAQASIDVQYTKDAWLWKLETIVREGQGDTFFAAVGGFEYTNYQVFGSGADLGLLLEYQYDGRDDNLVAEDFGLAIAAPITVADNDVFAGARLAFNDVQDTSLLAGATVDTDDGSTSVFVEAERRIGQNWKAELESRLFVNADIQNPLSFFERDDVVTFRLTRFF